MLNVIAEFIGLIKSFEDLCSPCQSFHWMSMLLCYRITLSMESFRISHVVVMRRFINMYLQLETNYHLTIMAIMLSFTDIATDLRDRQTDPSFKISEHKVLRVGIYRNIQ